MSRTVEPPMPQDALSPGDTIYAHTAEVAQGYRQAAAEAAMRQQSGLPPVSARGQVAAGVPAGSPLPSPQVARQVLGHEITRLSLQAESLQRQGEGQPFAFAGNANPYVAQVAQAQAGMRAQARDELGRVRAELARLEALDDHAVMEWARDFTATHPGPIRGR